MTTLDAALTVSIHLFGQLRITHDGAPFRFAGRRRTLALLGYLLLNRDRPVARDFLAFTLWPDDDEESARAKLRSSLHLLARSLPPAPACHPWVLAESSDIQWNPDNRI